LLRIAQSLPPANCLLHFSVLSREKSPHPRRFADATNERLEDLWGVNKTTVSQLPRLGKDLPQGTALVTSGQSPSATLAMSALGWPVAKASPTKLMKEIFHGPRKSWRHAFFKQVSARFVSSQLGVLHEPGGNVNINVPVLGGVRTGT